MVYVVCAPDFNEDNGGAIFLHYLADALNSLGEQAYVWRMPDLIAPSKRERLRRWVFPRPLKTCAHLNTPVFEGTHVPDDWIVVYPETLLGNPLNAKNIARWLLYKPGEIFPYEFTEDEMFFHCGEMFDMPELTGGAPELALWRRNRTYQNQHRPDRKGVAYVVRKGSAKDRLPITETPDAIRIDGMSHEEINDVFNRVEMFVSYDEATMYSQFAAICGCDSVIVPGVFQSHEEWQKSHPLAKYGVAYGFEHLPHARATRSQVIDMFDEKERESTASIVNFIQLTKARFFAEPLVPAAE
jgi:hypothetical protein